MSGFHDEDSLKSCQYVRIIFQKFGKITGCRIVIYGSIQKYDSDPNLGKPEPTREKIRHEGHKDTLRKNKAIGLIEPLLRLRRRSNGLQPSAKPRMKLRNPVLSQVKE